MYVCVGCCYHLALDSTEDEWTKQTRWSPPSGRSVCSVPLWFPFLPRAPADGFGRLRSHLLPPRGCGSPPKATARSRAGVEAPEPPSVLAGPWALALLALAAGDLCNTFPGLHFPADWKQSHCWFSPKKIYLEVQLPWITWWRERPDLAVNNFPLSHTGAWLAGSAVQASDDGAWWRGREGGKEKVCACERKGAHSWGFGSAAATLFISGVLHLHEWWGQRRVQNWGWASGLFPQLVYRTSPLVSHPATQESWGCVRASGSCVQCGVAQRTSFRIGHIPVLVPGVPMTVYGASADCFTSLTCFYPLKNRNKTGDGCGSGEYLCCKITVRIKGRNTGEITLPHA